MIPAPAASSGFGNDSRGAGRHIPIANLWLLLVYAAGLARFRDRFDTELERSVDLPSLFARLLTFVAERRLRRNVSLSYRPRSAVLRRVRGRIDIAETFLHNRLELGQIACRFEDLTADTPRNRLVRAALMHLAGAVDDEVLSQRCRTLANHFGRLGVAANRPSAAELARDPVLRHQADDLIMVEVARMAFDLALPTEIAGDTKLSALARDEMVLHQIFEKAVAGFYQSELPAGWRVRPQASLSWCTALPTAGLSQLLPQMRPDIILDHRSSKRRIVLDTKFTAIVKQNMAGRDRFSSSHIYQLYAYLKSQTCGGAHDWTEGILLYPAIGCTVDEAVTIQGHRLRFATVDLADATASIRQRLSDLALLPL